jgi:hypothetical protein
MANVLTHSYSDYPSDSTGLVIYGFELALSVSDG